MFLTPIPPYRPPLLPPPPSQMSLQEFMSMDAVKLMNEKPLPTPPPLPPRKPERKSLQRANTIAHSSNAIKPLGTSNTNLLSAKRTSLDKLVTEELPPKSKPRAKSMDLRRSFEFLGNIPMAPEDEVLPPIEPVLNENMVSKSKNRPPLPPRPKGNQRKDKPLTATLSQSYSFYLSQSVKSLFKGLGKHDDGKYVGLNSLERAQRAFKYKLYSTTASISVDGIKETYYRRLQPTETLYQNIGPPLGKGSYGVVIPAVEIQTSETVALKLLSPYHSSTDLWNEHHCHELMGTSAGLPIEEPHGSKDYVVMKLIRGSTLEEEFLNPKSKHDPLQLYLQAKALIQKLHCFGKFHGDTNTGNFIVDAIGQVYMIDYGNARAITMLDHRLNDYRKLCNNTLDEVKFRDDCVALKEEAHWDKLDPERNI